MCNTQDGTGKMFEDPEEMWNHVRRSHRSVTPRMAWRERTQEDMWRSSVA